MQTHRFRAMVHILLAACLLTACGAKTTSSAQPSSTGASASSTEASPVSPEASLEAADPAADPPADVPLDLLPELDVSALRSTMSEEDSAAFAAYLPVLRGEETFRWAAGPYRGYPDYGWETREVTLAEFHDGLWRGNEEHKTDTLELDRLAVQDIDGDGAAELILLFRDMGYNDLVLHREEDAVYGTDLSVRWFEDLQKNGVYIGSGGAGDSTYYRMTFQNGRFEQEELAHRVEWADGCTCTLGGETVPEEAFDAWYAENMVGGVTWYAPDGSVIPENP
ncbi:MAG: hypothetical protein PUC45_06830 [Oscillospiraceae bacterium]|nr:hypothetical protein [Oscillospiraceae bacterium]